MFEYIEARSEIARCQRQLSQILKITFSQRAVRNIGYPGGQEKLARLCSDQKHWFFSKDLHNCPTPRRLNWFGIKGENASVSIAVEINPAYEGRNDRASGFFARDPKSGIRYLFHSGRVGGGFKGVGKDAFLTWAVREGSEVFDVFDSRGKARKGISVCSLDDPGAGKAVSRYIDTVLTFKRAARNGVLTKLAFTQEVKRLQQYFAEPRGRRQVKRKEAFNYISRHGEIVDALHDWRRKQGMKPTARIVKSVLIDLGVEDNRKLIELYEVKPSTDRTSMYTGLGQLLVHSHDHNCKMAIVVPNDQNMPADVSRTLKRLKIKTMTFQFYKNRVVIVGSD